MWVTGMYNFLKRGFDIFFSAIILMICSPLLIVIAIGIKLSSKGPVFYISERVGKNGRLFKMLKFRSMHVKDADVVENRYLVNTQRIFAFGAFLRKSKLDELPQMINVLCGHMSFVGPRPYPQKAFDRLYSEDYRVVSVRPGLACLDSLYDYAHGDLFIKDAEYYKENIIPVRTELARIYVEKRSVVLDLYCVFRTIQLIFQIVILKEKEFSLTKYEKTAIKRIETNQMRVEYQNS